VYVGGEDGVLYPSSSATKDISTTGKRERSVIMDVVKVISRRRVGRSEAVRNSREVWG